MATLYEETPTLVDRIVAADLVITGRVGQLVSVQRIQAGDQPRVLGLFEVSVEHIIWGEPSSDRILVRVFGAGQDERAAWIVPIEEEQLALLLVRDVEPGLPDNVFAPYFASGFPVTAQRIRLPDEVVDDLTREVAGVEDSTIAVESLDRLVQEVSRRQETRDRELQEVEPAELREQPYRPVVEMPQPDVSGARSATPEGEPPQIAAADPPAVSKPSRSA
jgi:hypothetical protein